MLSPNTAQPGRSVWNRIDRKKFEDGLDKLHNTNFVLGPQTLRKEDWPKPRKTEIFPFDIEKQLSDDIAFVSAYDYGVGYVTAAAVEASKCDGLLVRLAANEGICATVTDALTCLFSTLEKCANKALSREQCVEDALNIVLTLNRNRILGRMGSRHFQRPQHENGPARIALSERLKACTKSLNHQSTETAELHRHVAAFHIAFLDVEKSGADVGTLRRVAREAYQLTVDGISLIARLESAGFSPSRMDSREIREVNKIANYWRICHSLAHLSRSYRTLFSKMKLESIEPFAPSRHGSRKKRFVHAEIQLLVYYERRGLLGWPRVLGASKEACFLCNSFIKAHGFFCVSKAHRQIYSRWTIPDLAEYSAETLDRLQRTLATVYCDVLSTLEQARRSRNSRPCPPQSSINLHHPHYPTPSVTTICSSPSEPSSISRKVASPSLPRLSPIPHESELLGISQLSLPNHSSAIAASSSISSNGLADNSSHEEPSNSSKDLTIRVKPNFPKPTIPTWLDIYVSLERSSSAPPPTTTFSTASVNHEYLSSSTVLAGQMHHRLDLSTLAVGQEIVLPNLVDPNADVRTDAEMSVILTYPRMDPVLLTCFWHGLEKGSM